MLPYFYEDVNSKCLHEVANAYTDTDLLSNSQKIPLSGYSMSELDWENTQSNLGNENFIPGRTMSKFVILGSDTSVVGLVIYTLIYIGLFSCDYWVMGQD